MYHPVNLSSHTVDKNRIYRCVLLLATTWAFATALIRPFAGDPIWDFVERTAKRMTL